MTNEELKIALLTRRPVILKIASMGEIEYAYVSGIIYRRDDNGGIYVEAEVMDRCLHSVTRIGPEAIRFKEGR